MYHSSVYFLKFLGRFFPSFARRKILTWTLIFIPEMFKFRNNREKSQNVTRQSGLPRPRLKNLRPRSEKTLCHSQLYDTYAWVQGLRNSLHMEQLACRSAVRLGCAARLWRSACRSTVARRAARPCRSACLSAVPVQYLVNSPFFAPNKQCGCNIWRIRHFLHRANSAGTIFGEFDNFCTGQTVQVQYLSNPTICAPVKQYIRQEAPRQLFCVLFRMPWTQAYVS